MSSSDSSSESETSNAPRSREKSPAFSPRKQRRTGPHKQVPSLARNRLPHPPRFSSIPNEHELALQQQELQRRNLLAVLPPGPNQGLPIPVAMLIEQKLALQQLEIQRLLNDNQQLTAIHIALRQELAALQDQLRLRQELSSRETEKDEHIRSLVERVSKQEVDLRAMASLKDDLEKLLAQRQELSLKAQTDAVQLATLKSQINGLQKELDYARIANEQERKASADHLAHRQAMERSYHSVLEEVGRLRIELANADRKLQEVSSGPPFYGGQSFRGNGNDMQQKPWGYQAPAALPGQPFHDMMPSVNGQPYHLHKNLTGAASGNGQNEAQSQGSLGPSESTSGKEWSTHMASNGQYFYYNSLTGVTQWEKPAAMAFQDQYHVKVHAQPLVQQENSQHPMHVPARSQQLVSQPNESAWSAQQTNTHTPQSSWSAQTNTDAPHSQAPGQSFDRVDQVAAQGAGDV